MCEGMVGVLIKDTMCSISVALRGVFGRGRSVHAVCRDR